jgi:hypothetical protein
LDDDSVYARLPGAVDKLERLGQLVLKYDDVCGEIDPNPTHVCISAHLRKALEGEVLGAASRIEAPHSQVHGVCTVGHGGVEGVLPASWRQELRA